MIILQERIESIDTKVDTVEAEVEGVIKKTQEKSMQEKKSLNKK